jgi:hypothetical protein
MNRASRYLAYRVAVLVCASWVFSAPAQLTDEQIEQLASEARGYINIDKRRLSSADIQSLIQYLRTEENAEESLSLSYFLVKLGDEAMIEKYAERFAAGDVVTVRELFQESGSPRAVEVLVPLMFKEERYQRFGGDVPHVPISFFAAAAIPMVLGNSPSFNSEVIQWAQNINRPNGHIEYPEIRAVMRDWWRANEQHFKAKNYKAVQPGREPKVIPPPPVVEELSIPTTVPPSPETPIPAKSRAATSTPQLQADSSWFGFVILAGCAALLAAALVFLARQTGKG